MMEKGFRDGIDKKKLMKEMTEGDWKRIQQQKDFEKLNPGTFSYDLVLFLDDLRDRMRITKSVIEKRLWNINDITNQMNRLKMQLLKGDITEKLKDGVTMINYEVNSLIQHQKWIIDGEVRGIPAELGALRANVGHFDVRKDIVLTEKEFDKYANEIKKRLKAFGYEIFS